MDRLSKTILAALACLFVSITVAKAQGICKTEAVARSNMAKYPEFKPLKYLTNPQTAKYLNEFIKLLPKERRGVFAGTWALIYSTPKGGSAVFPVRADGLVCSGLILRKALHERLLTLSLGEAV